MKKTAILAGVVGLMTAAPAMANNQVTFELEANVPVFCGVYDNSAGGSATQFDVDFADLSTVAAGNTTSQRGAELFYRCNSPAGFTRTITSANGGVLQRTGGASNAQNQIGYRIQSVSSGNSDIVINGNAPLQLTSPVVDAVTTANRFILQGRSQFIDFIVDGVGNNAGRNGQAPGTTVFAGDYADTVTLDFIAN